VTAEPCPTCGRRDLAHDAGAAKALLSAVRDQRRCLPWRTEDVFEALTTEERIGVYRWLRTTLRRPPLAEDRGPFGSIVALLDALSWDLADQTPDPSSPTIQTPDGARSVPFPHLSMIEADHGIEHRSVEPGRSITVQVDGYGIEVGP
jgi:hypothetical protein